MQNPIQENEDMQENGEVHKVVHANIGKCIDFKSMIPALRREEPDYEDKIGWRIVDVELAFPGFNYTKKNYIVKSDFGNGDEEKSVKGEDVIRIYDCPQQQQMNLNGQNNFIQELPGVEGVNLNNGNMEGGKKRRKSKKTRKSRKAHRKGRKGTRKH